MLISSVAISTYTFDRSLLPVPAMKTAVFCDKLDNTPLDDFANDLHKFSLIGIGVIIALVGLLIVLLMLKELIGWRMFQRHLARVRTALGSSGLAQNGDVVLSSEKSDGFTRSHCDTRTFDLVLVAAHPFLARTAMALSHLLRLRKQRSRTLIRWYLAWLLHPAALAALAMGLAGLITTQMQLVALHAVEGHYSTQLERNLDALVQQTLGDVNATMWDASRDFAQASNTVLQHSQDGLNDHLFQWVNTTTGVMNNTLNEVSDAIADVLNVSSCRSQAHRAVC